MGILYINARQEADNHFSVSLESYITLFIYQLSKPDQINLSLNCSQDISHTPTITIEFIDVEYEITDSVPEITTLCVWPVILVDNNLIAGLCSIARELVRNSTNEDTRKLLGFRNACLMACSESSIWTKFCEVDIVETIKSFLESKSCGSDESTLFIPVDFARFEYHLQQPVKMHNIYKLAREKNKNKEIKSSVPVEYLNLFHTYAEGPSMTLSDIMLYPCFKIYFDLCKVDQLKEHLPLTVSWLNNLNTAKLNNIIVHLKQKIISEVDEIVEPDFVRESLYKADPSRYKPEKRMYTKQNDVESSLNLIKNLSIDVVNDFLPYGYELNIDWSEIPLEANPKGGALPKKRASRKCDQLENLAKAVLKLANNQKYKIVDFCSGSGHLGILLACLLPTCKITLVENKERSLARAKERIKKLNLSNISIAQCNLDYFNGHFDIGVSLHACGVATDLVIQNCINKNAHFVCCPCCYGGIKDCHHLSYPRSKEFCNLDLKAKEYLSLAHAADQTHDIENVKTKQGYLCMDIIDTDRKLHAERHGYKVFLGKLQPTTCTNKNNLLVGISPTLSK